MNPDGSGLANVTAGAAPQARMPSWSPDAERIAFASEGGNPGWSDIFTVDAGGGPLTNVTNTPDAFEFMPAWSPDGAKIAFMTDEGNGLEVYTIAPDGTGRTNVSSNNYSVEEFPAWSPDGSRIAFGTQREDNGFANAIWLMNADGSAQTRLTDGVEPSWSPDGGKIAFAAAVTGAGPLQTINADGTGQAAMPGSGPGETDPVWSPDGQQVAFRAGGFIHTRNVDGSGTTLLAEGAFPDWARVPPNEPPDCSGVAADRATLRPPNHRLRLVTLRGASDPDGDQVAIDVTAVTQDEPVRAQPGDRSPDARITSADDSVRLRAERLGGEDGRVYRIAFTASDGQGGECAGTTSVEVPRIASRPAVDSAPPPYDSFGH